MSQVTTPAVESARGFNGQLADSHGPKDIVTSLAVAAALLIGRLVTYDQANGDDAAKAPAAATDVTTNPKGIVLHAHSQESSQSGDPQWPQGAAVPTLTKGRVYVEVEGIVDEGGKVFVRFQGGNEGKFRADDDGGDAAELPNAVFRSTTTGSGIAVVEINLPA